VVSRLARLTVSPKHVTGVSYHGSVFESYADTGNRSTADLFDYLERDVGTSYGWVGDVEHFVAERLDHPAAKSGDEVGCSAFESTHETG